MVIFETGGSWCKSRRDLIGERQPRVIWFEYPLVFTCPPNFSPPPENVISMERIACIYALCDPKTNEVRYVGKALDPYRRLRSHLSDMSAVRKARWIRSLLRDCLIPNIAILEVVSELVWEEAECSWIAFYRRIGHDLTNHTDGGEGLHGVSEDTRHRMSVKQKRSMKDPAYRAKIFTPERARKLSVSMTGRPKTPEHVSKLKQNRPGWNHRPETIEKQRLNHRRGPYGQEERDAIRKRYIGNCFAIGNKSRSGQTQCDAERIAKSLSEQGVPKTDGHKERISQGQKAAWKRRRARGETLIQGDPIRWPEWSWVQDQLRSMTVKQLASRLNVKPGTLSGYIFRQRKKSSSPVQEPSG